MLDATSPALARRSTPLPMSRRSSTQFSVVPRPSQRDRLLPDDATLVERIAGGDESAFELLFTTYYGALCTFTLGYVALPEAAEDVVQGVMLRVWTQRVTWAPRAGVRAFLFAACRNAALDLLRHRTVERHLERRRELFAGAPAVGTSLSLPDDAAAANDLAERLGRAVAALPEKRRAVVLLKWQQQLGPTEIASVLGLSVKGVEAHLARAFAVLRKLTYLRG
jgi:RNA polymerase sigma-70 factor (ECF subfamily)